MPQVQLGKIERIPARDVWRHEALDFTKWLAQEENLTQLGNACSIDLEFVDMESAVGSFAVDIFAKESGSDRRVVIENQLEDTNHDHLGKIITYAAGKNAEVVIWVVARARRTNAGLGGSLPRKLSGLSTRQQLIARRRSQHGAAAPGYR